MLLYRDNPNVDECSYKGTFHYFKANSSSSDLLFDKYYLWNAFLSRNFNQLISARHVHKNEFVWKDFVLKLGKYTGWARKKDTVRHKLHTSTS